MKSIIIIMSDTVKHKLSNLIHDVKEKVTDQEYKELMETLALVGAEPVQDFTDAKFVRFTYRRYRYTHPHAFINNLDEDIRDRFFDSVDDVGELYRFKLSYLDIQEESMLLKVVESRYSFIDFKKCETTVGHLNHMMKYERNTVIFRRDDVEFMEWIMPIKVEVVV